MYWMPFELLMPYRTKTFLRTSSVSFSLETKQFSSRNEIRFLRRSWVEFLERYLKRLMGVKVGSETRTYLMHCKICSDFAIVTSVLESISKISRSEH